MNTHDDPTITNPDDGPAAGPGGTAADGHRAAAQLLEVAARNADELLAEAKAEADQLKASAREEADQLLAAARTEAQRLRTDLEETRAQHNAEIARLQQIEQDHRDQMRHHLTDLLAQIEATPPA
jgi:cell division septum initiation protein DivIVA